MSSVLDCYVKSSAVRTENSCSVDDLKNSIDNATNAGACQNPYKGNSEVFDSNGRVAAESNSNGKYVVIKSQSSVCGSGYKYQLFSEYYASNLTSSYVPDNWLPLINAMKHYGGVVGVPGNIVYEISNETDNEHTMMFTRTVVGNNANAIIKVPKDHILSNTKIFDNKFNFIVVINHENHHLKHSAENINDKIDINHALAITEALNFLATNNTFKNMGILSKSNVFENEMKQIVKYLSEADMDEYRLNTNFNNLLKPVGYKLFLTYDSSTASEKVFYKKSN